jgi:hypothetical protein
MVESYQNLLQIVKNSWKLVREAENWLQVSRNYNLAKDDESIQKRYSTIG